MHLPRQHRPTHQPHHTPHHQRKRHQGGRRRTPYGHYPSPPDYDRDISARELWAGMLDSVSFPSDDDCHALVANLQFPAIRDRLIADIPGLDEPMKRILFAQTQGAPKWSRIEWAQQLLLHAYTRTSPQHQAPVLTTIGYINWWEGRGSKAHQFLQLALDTDPTYRLARLSDQMIASGLVAGWNMNKNTAYKALPFEIPVCQAVVRQVCCRRCLTHRARKGPSWILLSLLVPRTGSTSLSRRSTRFLMSTTSALSVGPRSRSAVRWASPMALSGFGSGSVNRAS
ncbi:DUF4192 family protein [Arthrobacter sp. SD76]|uniref:DUF4192 family protein n=1 Tax=Arthrobacter sp. SD76 TaxID=3415007 RepID=UPI003C7934A2